MPDWGSLSREELIALIQEQGRLIAELTAEVERFLRDHRREG